MLRFLGGGGGGGRLCVCVFAFLFHSCDEHRGKTELVFLFVCFIHVMNIGVKLNLFFLVFVSFM